MFLPAILYVLHGTADMEYLSQTCRRRIFHDAYFGQANERALNFSVTSLRAAYTACVTHSIANMVTQHSADWLCKSASSHFLTLGTLIKDTPYTRAKIRMGHWYKDYGIK
jgi:hypothetical protein